MDTDNEKEKTKKTKNNEIAFEDIVPEFSFAVSGTQISIRTNIIRGAEGYEVFKSRTPRGKYEYVVGGTSAYQEYYDTDKSTACFKVRAYKIVNDEKIYTGFSKYQRVDIISSVKENTIKIDNFFEAIKEIGATITYEDLQIAQEALKLATWEVQEKEDHRKAEEEAEKLKKEEEQKKKRRLAAVKRAEARREKKRLAHVEEISRMDLPLDFVNAYSNDDRANAYCESMADALMMSLDMLGLVDIEFISQVTGEEPRTVIQSLKGSIYQNPLYWNEVFYKGWETADEYLSGNLMHKYKVAKEANEKYNGLFQNNVTALEGIMQPDVSTEDIYVTLGSPWVPADVIDEFIEYMAFGGNFSCREATEYFEQSKELDFQVKHDPYLGQWSIPNKHRFRKAYFHGAFDKPNFEEFGSERMDMLYVLENTLNQKTLCITDLKDPNDKNCKDRIINQTETMKILERQKHMIEVFRRWIWQDEDRKKRLQTAYCNKYANIRKRTFNGSFLELPGLSEDIKLFDYQKNAVARILFSPNTLLSHDVGSGKTYIMIAAGMELRRLGKSQKNLYVIPNNIIGQWESIFKTMYPEAKLLVVTVKNFGPKKRNDTLNKILTDDYDAILMTYSCFDMLSLSDRYYINLYKERLELLEKARSIFDSRKTIEKKQEAIRKKIEELQKTYRKRAKYIPFDQLEINTLFLDEAHNYKNINLESKISRIRGSGSGGSDRGLGMMDKVHCIQRHNNGGRIINQFPSRCQKHWQTDFCILKLREASIPGRSGR